GAELRRELFEDGDSTSIGLPNSVGNSYRNDGQYDKSAQYLRIAVQRAMRSRSPVYYPFSNLTEVELELGDANAAVKAAEQLNKYFPGHPRYARVKAVIALNREQYDSALYWSRKLAAFQQFAFRSEGQYKVGMVQLMRGHVTAGLKALRDNASTEAERNQPATVLDARIHVAEALAIS